MENIKIKVIRNEKLITEDAYANKYMELLRKTSRKFKYRKSVDR
jgi:hypothetical protein